MGALVLAGNTSGSVTVDVPAVAGSNTATFPASTGTVMVTGNMPAFSAYRTGTQAITALTWTKIQFNTEEFDTNNNYDPTTNYRFTPTVAGYYQVTVCVEAASSQANAYSAIYKNGSIAFRNSTALGAGTGTLVTALVFMNGTTDYVEGYVNYASSINASGSSVVTYFQGVLVRGA
jgi:hypothetical protein